MLDSLIRTTFDTIVENVEDTQLNSKKDIDKLKVTDEYEQRIRDVRNSNISGKVQARNMQIHALNQEDAFSKRFIYYLALIIVIGAMVFMFLVLQSDVMSESTNGNLVLGGLMSTITMIVSFFFGSSIGSKHKTDILKERYYGI